MRYLPTTKLGFGAIPDAPAGFYPQGSESDVMQEIRRRSVVGITYGLSQIDDGFARANMSKPVAASVPVFRAVVSSAAGMDFNGLVAAIQGNQTSAQTIATIANAIGGTLEGTLAIAEAIGKGEQVSQTIQDASDAIPVISGIATAIVGLVVEVVKGFGLRDEVTDQYAKQIYQDTVPYCNQQLQIVKPTATLGGQLSPADMFRNVAYTAHLRQQGQGHVQLPLDVASMYVMLCGGESQGLGMSREEWRSIIADARHRNPAVGNGIPVHVQRTMFRLIKGILAMSQPPLTDAPSIDSGRSLMPLLQDVAREYYLKVQRGEGPGWDDYVARRCSDWLASQYRIKRQYPVPGGATVMNFSADCAGRVRSQEGFDERRARHIDLSDALIESIVSYQHQLLQAFFDQSTGDWRIKPNEGFGATRAKTAKIILSNAAARRTIKDIDAATSVFTIGDNVKSVAAGSFAGLAAYYAAQRFLFKSAPPLGPAMARTWRAARAKF